MKNIRTYHDLPTCEMCFWSSSLDLFRVSFPYNFFFFFRPCAIFLVLLCNNWPKNSYHSKYISDSWDFRIVWAYHLIHVFQIWSRGFFFGFQCFLLDFQLHSYRSFNTRGKLFLVHTWTIGVSNILKIKHWYLQDCFGFFGEFPMQSECADCSFSPGQN